MARRYTKDVLSRYKVILVNELKRQLRSKKPPTTLSDGSRLEDSISTKDISKEGVEGISILMNSYGLNVNNGRIAGKGVPPRKLDAWVRRNRVSLGIDDAKPSSIRRVGFLINRSIIRNGIRPTRFIDIVIEKVEPRFNLNLVDAFLKDLIDELDKKIPKPKKN